MIKELHGYSVECDKCGAVLILKGNKLTVDIDTCHGTAGVVSVFFPVSFDLK